jgi:hypothetical protein
VIVQSTASSDCRTMQGRFAFSHSLVLLLNDFKGQYQEIASNGNTVGQVIFDTVELCMSSINAVMMVILVA